MTAARIKMTECSDIRFKVHYRKSSFYFIAQRCSVVGRQAALLGRGERGVESPDKSYWATCSPYSTGKYVVLHQGQRRKSHRLKRFPHQKNEETPFTLNTTMYLILITHFPTESNICQAPPPPYTHRWDTPFICVMVRLPSTCFGKVSNKGFCVLVVLPLNLVFHSSPCFLFIYSRTALDYWIRGYILKIDGEKHDLIKKKKKQVKGRTYIIVFFFLLIVRLWPFFIGCMDNIFLENKASLTASHIIQVQVVYITQRGTTGLDMT